MSWRDFLNQYADTMGVTAVFALMGASFLLWTEAGTKAPLSRGRALTVLSAALLVAGVATAFVHGFLGWTIFVAPLVGVVSGLVALPLILTVAKGGRRVEMRADDIADKGIDLLPGKKDDSR